MLVFGILVIISTRLILRLGRDWMWSWLSEVSKDSYLLFMDPTKFSGEHDEAVNQREIYSVFGQSYKPDQKKCKSQLKISRPY